MAKLNERAKLAITVIVIVTLLLLTWEGYLRPWLWSTAVGDGASFSRRHQAAEPGFLGQGHFRENEMSPEKGEKEQMAEEPATCEMCDQPIVYRRENRPASVDRGRLPLFRYYGASETLPGVDSKGVYPGQIPSTVHYLWCQTDYFTFQHYLGVLSIIRLLRPLKLIFHYSQLPLIDQDMYYSWFLELKQSLPNLVLSPMKSHPPCGSQQLLDTALTFLQQGGGIFVGTNIILSSIPHDLGKLSPIWYAFCRTNTCDLTRGVLIAKGGSDPQVTRNRLQRALSGESSCVSPEEYSQLHEKTTVHCICVSDKPDLYPRDIAYADNAFAELSRWLYYGKRSPRFPRKVEGSIPRISHLVWYNIHPAVSTDMEFYQFLSVLSALYIGGFRHVYIHGPREFTGLWWEKLKVENVTFVFIDEPETIYQQKVNLPAHKSDVLRYQLLYKYGGAYQDFDVVWTNRVPDWLLSYPVVVNSDWVRYGLYPDNINNGLILARPAADWLRHNLAAHRYYLDTNLVWNSILVSYKVYERHPELLYYHKHLQVMCDLDVCHPTWEEGFQRDINDHRPTKPFDWRTETLSVHVTRPHPEEAFISLDALKQSNNIFAEIGRNVLRASGRNNLLK